MPHSDLTTHQKAIQINLDPAVYGAFAEIGAGQEIARWFFRVGGAAGTVAKTMSAYDMTVSDAIYGKTARYVSHERLLAMFEHEFELLTERLREERGENTTFFVFADTVSARNYKGTNVCHGWMGVRFQTVPGGPTNDIILHVNMLDRDNVLQQEALGVLGINLLHGAFYDRNNVDSLVENLLDDLAVERLEIDVLEFNGPAFAHIDNRVVGLKLLELGLAHAIIFTAGGQLIQPSEIVYKRPVIVERGAYRAMNQLSTKAVEAAHTQFLADYPVNEGREPLSLLEISVHDAGAKEAGSLEMILKKVDQLSALGHRVMVTNFHEFFQVTSYLRRYTSEPVAFVMGVATLARLMHQKYYEHLEGRLLEGLGRIVSFGVCVYVYPMTPADFEERLLSEGEDPVLWHKLKTAVISVDDVTPPAPNDILFSYLRQTGFIRPLLQDPNGQAKS